ncbi:MAG: 1-deoxy-D-xylulose-5-phosphate reductoisomerase [Mogibacterium sp.]|nr:1-deoxy-D-xylulose-5-phosphate reductoisomerase [Mogibacterium sp.]
MKSILILGSTGSIGTQALEIIRNNKDKFRVAGLTCRSRLSVLIEQIREFQPEAVCVGSSEDADSLKDVFENEMPGIKCPEIFFGDLGLVEIARIDCDIVLNALMGISGLAPTYEAISKGRDIALANKETLVAGGEIITGLCREKGVRLLPVDSEHSAIFQCLEGNGGSACGRAYKEHEEFRKIRRVILTASGGPFRGRSLDDMKNVGVEQALNHPNWDMGAKITIDSATMMNKGLEVIEARWLFDIPAEKIDIHVHPESIVHSMVEFMDGSVISQMGLPDMRIPIGLALSYPERLTLLPEFSGIDEERERDGSLDFFTKGARLTFERADRRAFKCLDIAYSAIEKGGSAPVIMNGANEQLVALFLEGKIGFTDIADTIEAVMDNTAYSSPRSVEEILEIDRLSRIKVGELLQV